MHVSINTERCQSSNTAVSIAQPLAMSEMSRDVDVLLVIFVSASDPRTCECFYIDSALNAFIRFILYGRKTVYVCHSGGIFEDIHISYGT